MFGNFNFLNPSHHTRSLNQDICHLKLQNRYLRQFCYGIQMSCASCTSLIVVFYTPRRPYFEENFFWHVRSSRNYRPIIAFLTSPLLRVPFVIIQIIYSREMICPVIRSLFQKCATLGELKVFTNPILHHVYVPQCIVQNRNVQISVLNGIL